MFFFLSKTLNYLTMPFVVVCLLFLISGLLKNIKWKVRLFWTAFGLLIFFSNAFIANEVVKAYEPDPVLFQDIPRQYTFGILLTGVTSIDSEPRDRVHFNMGADRVVHTLQLYKEGWIKKILVSGRSGKLVDNGRSEASEIKEALILMGVPADDIMTEEISRNTHESAVEVKKILEPKQINASDCLLITSAFHMPRSLACYRKLGLMVDSFSTDYHATPRNFSIDILLIPKLESFLLWHKLIREWVGLIAYKVAGYV